MNIRRENRLGYCTGCKQSTNQTRVVVDRVADDKWICRVCGCILQSPGDKARNAPQSGQGEQGAGD